MNQAVRKFVEIVASAHQVGPVVEFGARQVSGLENIAELRPLFSGLPYAGCDLVMGRGVDLIADCATQLFSDSSIGTILCCEMLEHCENPQAVTLRAMAALKDDGLLIITTPFLFGIHHVPDYWRFTPQAMDLLLRAAPYRMVLFKGDIWLPFTILAIATKSKGVFLRVETVLNARLGEMPAKYAYEQVFRWTGQDDYVRLRNRYGGEVDFKLRYPIQGETLCVD